MKKLLAFGIILLFISISVIPSTGIIVEKKATMPTLYDGNTLYVGGNGTGNYSRIQDAIDNTSDGDTVFVYNDSSPYYENIVINKSINLIGEDKNTTIIDGNENYYVVCFSTNKINIINFTITNAHYGIKIFQGFYYEVDDCIITNNRFGIDILDSSDANINNCIINENELEGIALRNSSLCTINNCVLSNPRRCITIQQKSAYNNIINCTLSGTHFGGLYGLDILESKGNKIEHCRIFDNRDGIGFFDSLNNTIKNCDISNNEDRAIIFSESVNNIVLNSAISYNGRDDESYAIEILPDSFNNKIDGCNISDNVYGGILILFNCNNNYVISSTISNNGQYGVACGLGSFGNHVFTNNFIGNSNQAYDGGNDNLWDNREIGNYWDDYNCVDENGDGIWDIPKRIDGDNNQDNFPLMFPYGIKSGIRIVIPEEGHIYLRNIKLFPWFTTVILGNIKIETIAANYIYDIEKVEFYVDNILRKIDTDLPYSWRWRLSSHIRHRHTIKVVAYDTTEASIDDELKVWRFF